MRGIILFLLCALCAAQTSEEVHIFDNLGSQLASLGAQAREAFNSSSSYSFQISHEAETLQTLKAEASKFSSDLRYLDATAQKLADCCTQYTAKVQDFHRQVKELHVAVEDNLQALNEAECFLQSLVRASERNTIRVDAVNKQLTANTEQIIKLRQILENLQNSIVVVKASVDENKISIAEFQRLVGEFSTTVTAMKKIVLINSQDIRLLSQEIQKNEFTITKINEELKLVGEKVQWINAHIGDQKTETTDIWRVINEISVSVTNIKNIYDKSSITITNINNVISSILISIETLFKVTDKHKVNIKDIDSRWTKIDIDIESLTKVVHQNSLTIVSIKQNIVDNNTTLINLNTYIHDVLLVNIEKCYTFFKEISDVQRQVNINVQHLKEFHLLLRNINENIINVNVTIRNVFQTLIEKIIQQQGSSDVFREKIKNIWSYINNTHEVSIHNFDLKITEFVNQIEKIITLISEKESHVSENTVDINKLREIINSFELYITNVTNTYTKITQEVNEVLEVQITHNTENIEKLRLRVEKLTLTVNQLEIHVIKDLSAICQNLNITSLKIIDLENVLKVKIGDIWLSITKINNWLTNHVSEEADLEKQLTQIKIKIKNIKEDIKNFILEIENEVDQKIVINSNEISKISVDITNILTQINKIRADYRSQIELVTNNININTVNIQNLDKFVRVKIIEDVSRMYIDLESINVKVDRNTENVNNLKISVENLYRKIDTWKLEIDKTFVDIKNNVNIVDKEIIDIETRVKQRFTDIDITIENLLRLVNSNKVSITDISVNFKNFLNIVNQLTHEITILSRHIDEEISIKIKNNSVDIVKIQDSLKLITTHIDDIEIFIKNTILVVINDISVTIVNIRNTVVINTQNILKINTEVENNIKWINDVHIKVKQINEDIRTTNIWIHAQLKVLCTAVHINRKKILDIDNYIKVNITNLIESIDRKITDIRVINQNYESDVNTINIAIREIENLYNRLKLNIEEVERLIKEKISVHIQENSKLIQETDDISIDLENKFQVLYSYVHNELTILVNKIDSRIEELVRNIQENTLKINDVRVKVHQNSVNVQDILNQVTNIFESVNKLEVSIEDIKNIKVDIDRNVEINKQDIFNLNALITSITKEVNDHEGNIKIINTAITDITRIVDISRTTLEQYILDFKKIFVFVQQTEESINEINRVIYRITHEVNNNEVDITHIREEITSIKNQISVNIQTIAKINNELVSIQTNVQKNSVDIKALFGRFSDIKKEVWDNYVSIKKISIDFTQIQQSVEINIKNIDDLNVHISRIRAIYEQNHNDILSIRINIKNINDLVKVNVENYEKIHQIYLENTKEITLLQQLLHNQVLVLLHDLQTFVKTTLLNQINENHKNTEVIINEINKLKLQIDNNVSLITRAGGKVQLFEQLWACLHSAATNFKAETPESTTAAVHSLFEDPIIKEFLNKQG